MAIGDRHAALKQYEECERVLVEDLGVKPLPETTALYQWIKQTAPPSQVHEASLTHLPIPLTSFIGREQEVAEAKRLLATTRLLTLTGPGGCGKTRLATQVAFDLMDKFGDVVWLVELTALTDRALVPQSVAKALGVREAPNQPMIETLSNYLRDKRLLLVLDNCEHLVTACAQLSEG